MTARLRIPIFVLLILLTSSLAAQPLQQTDGNGDWFFPETGHTVSGEFLKYYQQSGEYMLLFGYPLTEVVDHPVLPGVKVQYFSRARMEWDPKAPEGQRMRLAPLGVWLYDETRHGKTADLPFVSGACRMFSGPNLGVCYDFLKFYDEHNGEVYFGEPISPMEKLANNRLVQYFERARMEWWPENASGNRVVLTDVGKMDLDRSGPSTNPKPRNGDNIPTRQNMKLVVHAFTARPLVSANSKQTVYVIVQDQFLQAVPGALVTLSVQMPDGQMMKHRLDETKINGLTQVDFSVGAYQPNQIVQVAVEIVIPEGPTTTTTTYFRIWW